MELGFDDIAIFLRIAREETLSGAGRALGLPTSTISRRLAALERRLGVQLVRRTTRAARLTDEGRALADRCVGAFEAIESAADSAADRRPGLSGRIRATAPHFACSETFGPYLLEFAARHPAVELDLRITNRMPDLIEDEIDVAFIVGPLRDTDHVARKLWPIRYALCVAPALLAAEDRIARIRFPSDLVDLPCVVVPPLDCWSFVKADGRRLAVTPRTVVARIDDLALAGAAVRRGLGVGYLPIGLIDRDLASGAIEVVRLDGFAPVGRDLFALRPATRHPSERVKAFIAFAQAGLDWHHTRLV